jgi:glutathione S-transferase
MGIDFYTTPASAPARMVLLFAKHLNVDLNIKTLDMLKGEHMKPEFIAINPQHTVPTMVDNGFVLTESRGILMYLQNKYGKDDSLYPKDAQQRALVEMRMFFDVSMLYPRFGDSYYPVMFGGAKAVDPAKLEKLNETLGFVENHHLMDGGYIAGSQLTIADFSMAAVLSTIQALHDISKFPKIVAYVEKCKGVMKGWDELNQQGCEEFAQWYKDALAKLKA